MAARSTVPIPTTLDEYKAYARAEALRVQKDMGWPDEKLNATLRALGLPEKQTFKFLVRVTAERFVQVTVSDADTEEAARDGLATNPDVTGAVRHARVASVEVVDPAVVAASLEEDLDRVFLRGESDTTGKAMASQLAVTVPDAAWCNGVHVASGYTCTRVAGHRGNHAGGYGLGDVIGAVWDVTPDQPSTRTA